MFPERPVISFPVTGADLGKRDGEIMPPKIMCRFFLSRIEDAQNDSDAAWDAARIV
jgi:hypothetical protein